MYKTRNLTLLYIEDDDALRKQFLRVLTPRFKHVYEAKDGLEALEKFEQYTPQMMIVDINLPKINGLEVIERIRMKNNKVCIVILSAYSDQEKLLRAIPLKLSQYLTKPVPQKKLLSVLDDMASTCQKSTEKKVSIALKNEYMWLLDEKQLFHNNEMIVLTKREQLLLDSMITQINTIVTFESIEELIWGNEDNIDTYSSLSHLLKRLRKKLPEELLESIYGEGYRISIAR